MDGRVGYFIPGARVGDVAHAVGSARLQRWYTREANEVEDIVGDQVWADGPDGILGGIVVAVDPYTDGLWPSMIVRVDP